MATPLVKKVPSSIIGSGSKGQFTVTPIALPTESSDQDHDESVTSSITKIWKGLAKVGTEAVWSTTEPPVAPLKIKGKTREIKFNGTQAAESNIPDFPKHKELLPAHEYLVDRVKLIHPTYVYLIKTGLASNQKSDEWVIVDLRTADNNENADTVPGALNQSVGSALHALDYWENSKVKPTDAKGRMTALIESQVSTIGKVASNANIKHVVFHCTYSKDRTPVMTAAYRKWAVDGGYGAAKNQQVYIMQGGLDRYAKTVKANNLALHKAEGTGIVSK